MPMMKCSIEKKHQKTIPNQAPIYSHLQRVQKEMTTSAIN